MKRLKTVWSIFLVVISISIFATNGMTNELQEYPLYIGWAAIDITPSKPVALNGQFYTRISQYVRDPLMATALAFETKTSNGSNDEAIMISVDMVYVEKDIQDELRTMIRSQLPDFDVRKLFLNATHTHSGPCVTEFVLYDTKNVAGLMAPDEYRPILMEKLKEAAVNAWKNRKSGGMSWGLGHAVVGHNRRMGYYDGSAMMYGPTDIEGFMGTEGTCDHGIELLFCWDEVRKLTGIVINVACPSQVTEAKYFVTADYWAEVRKQLKEKYSEEIFILPLCGASGDQSPRDLPRGYKGEPNMWDEEGMVEIGKRISNAVTEVYDKAKSNIKTRVQFTHTVKNIDLPIWRVTEDEYEKAVTLFNKLKSKDPLDTNSPQTAWNQFINNVRANEKSMAHPPYDDKYSDFVVMRNENAVIERYRIQNTTPYFPVELHVMRLGDIAFATNPFELFVDYGLSIKGRSRAEQTFVIQLCGDVGGYLPTERAVRGGGYGGMVVNGKVGPAGGKILVQETVECINALWK